MLSLRLEPVSGFSLIYEVIGKSSEFIARSLKPHFFFLIEESL